jgi:acetyl-CoA carboxylase carboxyltransferase component
MLSQDEALQMARDAVPLMNFTERLTPLWQRTADHDPPLLPPDELPAVCTRIAATASDGRDNPRSNMAGSMRDVLARLVDGSRFKEFKPSYGASMLCGWACLQGHPVAVVANAELTICADGVRPVLTARRGG